MKEWLTYDEAAVIAGLSLSGLKKQLQRGNLKSVSWIDVPPEQRIRTERLVRTYIHRFDVEAFAAGTYRRRAMDLPSYHRPEDLAYAAGFFDGEGCVGLGKNKGRRSVCYTLVVHATNVEPAVIHGLAETFGGTVMIRRAGKNYRRDLYIWQAVTLTAYQALRLMRPYLKVKHRQADIGIKFFEHVLAYHTPGIRTVSPEELLWRDEQRQRLHEINTPVRISVQEFRARFEALQSTHDLELQLGVSLGDGVG